jgi:hypothetical protein
LCLIVWRACFTAIGQVRKRIAEVNAQSVPFERRSSISVEDFVQLCTDFDAVKACKAMRKVRLVSHGSCRGPRVRP